MRHIGIKFLEMKKWIAWAKAETGKWRRSRQKFLRGQGAAAAEQNALVRSYY
jgi:hypothetical protein